MRTDRDEQAASVAGALADQLRVYVDRAQQLLLESHEAAQRAAARALETHRRLETTDRRGRQVAGAAEQTHQAAAVDRVVAVKRRELAAHRGAVALHEQAAELQERLGRPDRAAEARAHAEHARKLYRQASQELAEYRVWITAAKDRPARCRGDHPGLPAE